MHQNALFPEILPTKFDSICIKLDMRRKKDKQTGGCSGCFSCPWAANVLDAEVPEAAPDACDDAFPTADVSD